MITIDVAHRSLIPCFVDFDNLCHVVDSKKSFNNLSSWDTRVSQADKLLKDFFAKRAR